MAWIGTSLYSIALHILLGFTSNYPEKPETVQRDLRELGPTIGLAPPRFWENSLTQVLVRAADASPLKRRLFDYFRRVAERSAELKAEGKSLPPHLARARMVGEILVYAPLRDQLGWRR